MLPPEFVYLLNVDSFRKPEYGLKDLSSFVKANYSNASVRKNCYKYFPYIDFKRVTTRTNFLKIVRLHYNPPVFFTSKVNSNMDLKVIN